MLSYGQVVLSEVCPVANLENPSALSLLPQHCIRLTLHNVKAFLNGSMLRIMGLNSITSSYTDDPAERLVRLRRLQRAHSTAQRQHHTYWRILTRQPVQENRPRGCKQQLHRGGDILL